MHALPDTNVQSLLDAMAEVHSVLGPHHSTDVYALLASFSGDALHVRRVRNQGLVSSLDTLMGHVEPQPSSGDGPVLPM